MMAILRTMDATAVLKVVADKVGDGATVGRVRPMRGSVPATQGARRAGWWAPLRPVLHMPRGRPVSVPAWPGTSIFALGVLLSDVGRGHVTIRREFA
jgi:hypothetical protein